MEIMSKAYGKIEIDDRQLLKFPSGIFGFEDQQNFALLDSKQQPFYWLQSLDREDLAFVLIDPKIFRPDYTLEVHEEDIKELGDNGGSLLVFTIVTIPEDQNKMSANLSGPVLINRMTKIGKQVISTNENWKTRHYIMDELAATGSR